MNRHFKQLAQLYRTMDKAWDKTAQAYDFQCEGCEDNCCLSLFYHHTHIEKAFLNYGFSTLPESDRQEILKKAERYCEATFSSTGTEAAESKKIPCPLLIENRCGLYPYRPMICRMHGLPHELHRPGLPVVKGPGCDAGQFDDLEYVPFDRTPFYRDMAGIEMAFRTETARRGKIRQSIAQMLLDPN